MQLNLSSENVLLQPLTTLFRLTFRSDIIAFMDAWVAKYSWLLPITFIFMFMDIPLCIKKIWLCCVKKRKISQQKPHYCTAFVASSIMLSNIILMYKTSLTTIIIYLESPSSMRDNTTIWGRPVEDGTTWENIGIY